MTTTVVVERRIAASPGRVWESLTDLRRLPRLLTGVRRVEVLTEGGFAVGTRWRETRRLLGREATEEMTVTVCVPPERYATVAGTRGFRYDSEVTLRAEGPGACVLRASFTARPAPGRKPGPAARLLARAGARAVAKALAKDLEDLAMAVESPF
ncbi:SRPBCC family protein [Streptomyces termitum]